MIIDKDIGIYLINFNECIINALKKIEINGEGLVIVVDDDRKPLGVLTDGDFRRWLISGGNLNCKLISAINTNFTYSNIKDTFEKISSLFEYNIKFIPLVDDLGRCVAIARKRTDKFKIGNHLIGHGHPCFIIAEIGNNHNGDFNLACKLVDYAIEAGASCAKFQMRDLNSLYINNGVASDPREDLGSQYTLDLLSRFQLSTENLFRVFDYCNKRGIMPLCTPWDPKSIELLESYGIEGYKSSSADFTNPELLISIAKTGKPIICSTGMTDEDDIGSSIKLLQNNGAQFALLHCNSTYPAPFKDLNLNYIKKLRLMGNCPVGYSSHDRGIYSSIAALALGANIIEKHFTLDRSMEGNDHRVSLLPDEFSELVMAIRQVEQSLGSADVRRLSQGEILNKEVLGKSLVINVPLAAGQIFEDHMLDIKSPGKGLQPNKKHLIVGKVANRDLLPGDILYLSDVNGSLIKPRNYNFPLSFGVPVRFHDIDTIIDKSNFNLVEFHLSYKDMDIDPDKFFKKKLNKELVVHSPELFKGDHLLDLSSKNDSYRRASIENLQNVVNLTTKLSKWFPSTIKPKIIVNVGGFSSENMLDIRERYERYKLIVDSLNCISQKNIEILPQTMPPFPWHFGGQSFHNLFVDPDEIVNFCTDNGYRICLDVSHSKLACNFNKWSFSEFIKKVGPHTAHLHLADARGVDGEGLQILDGEIDFSSLISDIVKYAKSSSFIPEIWQGHKNNGEGFWIALDRLEKIFNSH